jgi:hypothetical protein
MSKLQTGSDLPIAFDPSYILRVLMLKTGRSEPIRDSRIEFIHCVL